MGVPTLIGIGKETNVPSLRTALAAPPHTAVADRPRDQCHQPVGLGNFDQS